MAAHAWGSRMESGNATSAWSVARPPGISTGPPGKNGLATLCLFESPHCHGNRGSLGFHVRGSAVWDSLRT